MVRITETVWKLRWIVLLNLYLVSPLLLHDFLARGGLEGLRDETLLFSATVSGLFLVGGQLSFRRPWKFHLLILPLHITVLAELFLIAEFSSRVTTTYATVALAEVDHAKGFVVLYGPRFGGWALLFAAAYGFALWKARVVETKPRARWAFRGLVALVLLYVTTVVHQMRTLPADPYTALLDVLTHDRNSPFGAVSQTVAAVSLRARERDGAGAPDGFEFGARKIGSPYPDGELHVLVIGESSRPDHWALNGYGRNTSPRLAHVHNLVSFSDAVAEIALTRYSVPLLITRATIADADAGIHERSVVSAFREAGYRTHWYSTQSWDPFTLGISQYALESDEVRFFEHRHDEVLLGALDELIAGLARGDRAFVVLHTQGSHWTHEDRYPPSFSVFSERTNAGDRRTRLRDTYDDTILYTDFVLSEIIVRLESLDAACSLLYVSDHGENLMDDDRELLGHFHNNEYDLRVPMLFWASTEFESVWPTKLAAARLNARRPISSSRVFPTLLDAANIRLSEGGRGRSLLNPFFDPASRLVFHRGRIVDFDATFTGPNTSALLSGR